MPFSFRLRSVQRDIETDELRLQRLGRMAAQIRTEIQSEIEGLERRYEGIAASAAFAQQGFESDGTRKDLSAKVQELTGSMMLYTRRMTFLGRQWAFISRVEKDITAFRESITRQA